MHIRSYVTASALLLAALGCRDDATGPTEPAATIPQATAAATTEMAFGQVSAGQFHACGVTTDNQAYCWGLNTSGQLGVGTNTGPEGCTNGIGTTSPCSTRPVLVAGGHRFRQLSAGANHTCAVTTDYRAYCWGSGGIGNGTVESLTPVAVAGGHLFRQVEAGFYFTCGVTYPEYKAYCWGLNQDGALGDGTLTSRLRPVLVLRGYQFLQVSAGFYHTCGVTTTHRAFCWGLNHSGQLGDSSTAYRRTRPWRVAVRASSGKSTRVEIIVAA
jgi:alpha-tubulin suppressor-like RCC1 family protein